MVTSITDAVATAAAAAAATADVVVTVLTDIPISSRIKQTAHDS